MTILIAEDAPIDAIVIRNIVEHAGYRAVVVNNGQEALHALAADRGIALVLADVMMPLMGGVELLRVMRETPEMKCIPVVFVSSAADAETVNGAVALGPAGYILKPVTQPSRVLERVERALGVGPAHAEAR